PPFPGPAGAPAFFPMRVPSHTRPAVMQGIYRGDKANLLAFNSALAGAGLKPEHATEVLGGAHGSISSKGMPRTTWETRSASSPARRSSCALRCRRFLDAPPEQDWEATTRWTPNDRPEWRPVHRDFRGNQARTILQANGLVSRSVDDSHGYNDVTT